MRPNTLAEAVEKISSGEPRDMVLAEFVDAFDLANTDQERYACIESEPNLTNDDRLNALVGAMAEYLAKIAVSVAFLPGREDRGVVSPIPGSPRHRLRRPCANT